MSKQRVIEKIEKVYKDPKKSIKNNKELAKEIGVSVAEVEEALIEIFGSPLCEQGQALYLLLSPVKPTSTKKLGDKLKLAESTSRGVSKQRSEMIDTLDKMQEAGWIEHIEHLGWIRK